MAFNVFTAYGAAARGNATLRASGYMFVSRGLMQRLGDEKPESVVLLYDEETTRLGIRLPGPGDSETATRSVNVEASGIAINVVPVLRQYGLERPTKKVMLDAKIEQGMIVIDMKPTTGNV